MGKCIFNQLWLKNEIYRNWIAPSRENDKYKAHCKLCKKEFELGKMGESALKAHMNGKKHILLQHISESASYPGGTLQSVFSKKSSVSSVEQKTECDTTQTPESTSSQKEITSSNYIQVLKKDVLDAEIRWALKCVLGHYSYNSCSNINELFQMLFPDSEIAKMFTCGPTKCAYFVCFGIAPFYSSLLFDTLKNVECFTLFFDESLNKTLQEKQMDVHVRFWDNSQKLETRYVTSVFMGHATAEDTMKAFLDATNKLDLSKTLQLSMDGPAVNWKLFTLFQKYMKDQFSIELVNIGSCSLHTLNNAFKTGNKATEWNLDSLLSALYWLFKDSPARREDFFKVSEMKKMPYKFCLHRWLENKTAAERALEIWEDIKNYVHSVETGKFTKPTSKSYHTVQQATKDNLICVKLNIFLSVTKMLTPFLTLYQSTKPLLPFLAEDLRQLILELVTNFNIIGNEHIEKLNNVQKLSKFDFMDKSFHSDISRISCGFVADRLIKKILFQKQASDKEIFELKSQCQAFLLNVLKNIVAKSPINNPIVRCLCCIDPRNMASDSYNCYTKMKFILGQLVKANRAKEDECEEILVEFNNFLTKVASNSSFSTFDPKENVSLDEFFANYLNDKTYHKLSKIIYKLLLLSHGQADVERGFSYNKMLEVENLKKESFMAQRVIVDYQTNCHQDLVKSEISKELRLSVASARQKYLMYLEEERNKKNNDVKQKKRKVFFDELEELKSKKALLLSAIEELDKSCEKLADKAESSGNIKYVYQSNSFRRSAKEKKNELSAIEIKIDKVLKNLKEN